MKLSIFFVCVILSYIQAKKIQTEKPELVSGDIYVSPTEVKKSLQGKSELRNYPFEKREVRKIGRQKRGHENEKNAGYKRTVAVNDAHYLWDEGIIPYEISSNISERLKKTIQTAMRKWESVSCIKFVPREDEHQYSIYFENKGDCGCCSYIGKHYLQQELTLQEDDCNAINIALHEIGHAIGFHHEQNRPDRDKYIKVLYEHIEEDQASQYYKLSEEVVNTLGYNYDFDSIMHYASNFFSTGKETMTVINNTDISLQERRRSLSRLDIDATNDLYQCPRCLFNLRSKRGSIYFNSSKTNETYCEWYIKRYEGEYIEFVIDYINIPDNENCTDDYLDIIDGYWGLSPDIDFFCGNKTFNKFYKTTSNQLLILFERSPSTKYAEFSLNYKISCDEIIEGDEGTITSPQSPEDYPYSSECQWTITVPKNYRVALTFQSFNINEDDKDCNSSYVQIWDVVGNDSVLLHTFCDSKMLQDVLSSENTLIIKFVSDIWEEGIGFTSSFVKEINECEFDDNGGCSDLCVNTIGSYYCKCEEGKHLLLDKLQCEEYSNECGGILNVTKSIVITSPSFPDPYPRNIKCTWEILNKDVVISFLHLDLQDLYTCPDKLEISGVNITTISVCGTPIPEDINLNGVPDIKIEFESDLFVQNTGFAILLKPL